MKQHDDLVDVDLDIKLLLDKLPNTEGYTFLYLRGTHYFDPDKSTLESDCTIFQRSTLAFSLVTAMTRNMELKADIYNALSLFFLNNKDEKDRFLAKVKEDEDNHFKLIDITNELKD